MGSPRARSVRAGRAQNSVEPLFRLPRESLDERRVGRRKGQLAQPFARDPCDLLAKHRLGLAFKATSVEMQGNGLARVGVRHTIDTVLDITGDVELLMELTPQRFAVGFSRKTLPAGKLPVALERDTRGPKRHQKSIVALDHRGDDDDDTGRHKAV
jgi:hypothetical protein